MTMSEVRFKGTVLQVAYFNSRGETIWEDVETVPSTALDREWTPLCLKCSACESGYNMRFYINGSACGNCGHTMCGLLDGKAVCSHCLGPFPLYCEKHADE